MDFYSNFFSKFKNNNESSKNEANNNVNNNKDKTPLKTEREILENLISLKKLVSQPKEHSPANRSTYLHQILKEKNNETSNETIKIERWHPTLYCPACKATKVHVIEDHIGKQNKYKCDECKNEFHDSSNTELEHSNITIHTWIECWYLIGLTTSIEYIAAKLNLDVQTTKMMVEYLQKIFRNQEPLAKHNQIQDKYNKGFFKEIEKQLQQKQEQLLGKATATQAKDTALERTLRDRRTIKPKA